MSKHLLACCIVIASLSLGCRARSPEPHNIGGSTEVVNGTPKAAPKTPIDQIAKPKPAPQAAPSPAKKPELPTLAPNPKLLSPSDAKAKAPETFAVEFTTTKGPFIMDVTRKWAPQGADRFYNLIKIGFYRNVAFFRVIDGFMAQIGIHGDPKVSAAWKNANIEDDPVTQKNTRGMVSYATAGPGTRTTQFFINFGDNSKLDGMGFAPFAKVRDMTTVEKIYKQYGEGAPRGRGPSQGTMTAEGNSYLRRAFPLMDYVLDAKIVPGK